jgi:predicted small secreted protein
MLATLRVPIILAVGSLALAGCANMEGFGGGDQMTTASVSPQPKIDPACIVLASQIDNLRREGVADKIEKAALKKYTMKNADLVKADQLTKANADFQGKCSTLPPRPAVQAAAAATPAAGGVGQVPVQAVAKAQPAPKAQ